MHLAEKDSYGVDSCANLDLWNLSAGPWTTVPGPRKRVEGKNDKKLE
jgi:hypothetical protein